MDIVFKFRCLDCGAIVEELASATLSILSVALQTQRIILCLCNACEVGRTPATPEAIRG